MKLSTKLILATIGSIAATAVIALLVGKGTINKQGERLTVDTMRTILDSAEDTRSRMSYLHERDAFNKADLLADLKKNGRDNFRQTVFFSTIPIVAAMQIAEVDAKKQGLAFRVVRENPRNPKNAPDEAERRILREVERPGVQEFVERDEKRGVIVTARPVVLGANCLACHGDPKTSSTGDSLDVTGFRMENWKEGEIRGAFILTSPIEKVSATVRASTTATLAWVVPCAGAICVGMFFFVRRQVVRPLSDLVSVANAVADGDLTRTLDAGRQDEIGEVTSAINATCSNLRKMFQAIAANAASLTESANLLTQTANSQAAGAEETNVQATTVAAAGEELATNSQQMSESASQITLSATTVAAAVEEMSASIQEVARNCAQESEIAGKADVRARQTRDLMVKLDEAATEIGKVVELINRIAGQTNLLALNATIEAASAGEAGRGFAVVANEVKELARQSASATEDIRNQISLIQNNAGSSMRSIDEVAKVIEEVSHIANSIAAAVEEQSATTSEIVRSLHGVTSATNSLSENVKNAADGASEVSRNIHGVSEAASESSKGASRITASARELNKLARELNDHVSRFKF